MIEADPKEIMLQDVLEGLGLPQKELSPKYFYDTRGSRLFEEITRTAERATGRASVYVTLRRLERKGLIRTERESAEEAPSGKPRRFVRVTPEAVTLVQRSRRALERMWAGLEDVLEDA